jgi:hypothetical protein
MTLPNLPTRGSINGIQLLRHKDKCLSGCGVNPEQRADADTPNAKRFGL